VLLAGEASAPDWLRTLWREARPVAPSGRWLLAPQAPAALGSTPPSPQVCNCHDVSEARVCSALAQLGGTPTERLAALQGRLRCGTRCGSCLPELRRLERMVPAGAAKTPATAA